MSVFNNIYDSALASFSDWIQVSDNKSGLTIEDFPYKTGVVENLTKPHCWKCVSINKCWFKNENGKKPEAFDYSNYYFKDILKGKRGLYHSKCHCKEKAIKNPTINDIKVIMPEGKILWLFSDKLKLTQAWGYHTKEEQWMLINNIIQLSKEAYSSGSYSIREHTPKGINATFYITITGINEKSGHKYNRISSYMIYPNGKIKNNTPIGDKW